MWTWEIQRRPKPLEVRPYEDGFKSPFAAKLAGEIARLSPGASSGRHGVEDSANGG
jgi:hypothetical protein